MKTQRVLNVISIAFMISALGTVPAMCLYELYVKAIMPDTAVTIVLIVLPVSTVIVFVLQVLVPDMIDRRSSRKRIYHLDEEEQTMLESWPKSKWLHDPNDEKFWMKYTDYPDTVGYIDLMKN